MRKVCRLFEAKIFERFGGPRTKISKATEFATIARRNVELLRDLVDVLRARDASKIELEALRVEVLEAHETVATLVEELNHSRMWAEYLEERLSDYEEGKVVPFRRERHRP